MKSALSNENHRALTDQHLQISASSAQWLAAVAAAKGATGWLARMDVLQREITCCRIQDEGEAI